MRKTVLITGASRGIGRAIAVAFAKADYNLVITCSRSESELLSLKDELETVYSVDVLASIGDISDYEYVVRLFAHGKERFHGVDVLINNAGISYIGLIEDMTIEEWNRIVGVNLTSVFSTSKLAIPYMLSKQAGKIINISSVWSTVGASCEVAYSACKGGMNSFTRGLAKELAPSNIQVNAIACGCIDPQMNRCFLKKNVPPLPMRSHPDDLVHRKKWLPLLYLSLKEMNTLPDRSSHWMESGSDRILLLKQRSSSFLSKGCFSVFTILHV